MDSADFGKSSVASATARGTGQAKTPRRSDRADPLRRETAEPRGAERSAGRVLFTVEARRGTSPWATQESPAAPALDDWTPDKLSPSLAPLSCPDAPLRAVARGLPMGGLQGRAGHARRHRRHLPGRRKRLWRRAGQREPGHLRPALVVRRVRGRRARSQAWQSHRAGGTRQRDRGAAKATARERTRER